MIAKLAKSTAYFFVEKQIVKKEDEEVYAYGMELLYSSIINIVLAVIIAIITNTVYPTAAFLGTFIVMRQYIGGYHAKTHLGCISIFAIVLYCFAILSRYIPEEYELLISIFSDIMSVFLVLKFAPVEHPNKPLSDKENLRLRKNGIISTFTVLVLVFILSVFASTKRYGMYISLGQLTASTAMLCEKIKHIRMNNNRED